MINLIHGDCLEEMKKIPDGSIDLVLTDPPYGVRADKGTSGFGSAKNRRYKSEWDSKTPDKEYFDEILRIGKTVLIFGGNFFTDKLPARGHWIVWDKKGEVAFKNPFSDCELIWTSIKKKPIKKYVFKQQGFITDSKDVRVHPTQKPSELVQQLIEVYSNENDTVLDCFMGSGTTGVACKNLNRNFIGIELDKEYFEIAKKRIGDN
jgi:DNA modification methylase